MYPIASSSRCEPDAAATTPRVSFVIVAFNQSHFIDEAVAAALAQDYSNLQIILSDDNSSDDTFERMAAAAGRYRGPHSVVLNRSPGGRGLLAHFNHALAIADGELFVGAAGDDISLPNRVGVLVERWRRDRPAAVYSAWNRVDVEGRFLSRDGIDDQHDRDFAAYFPDRPPQAAAFGCSAAYDTAFLRSIPIPDRPIWSEDYFLSLVAMLRGETIAYVDEPLVLYRQNPQAQRNFATMSVDYATYEEREGRSFAGIAVLAETVLAMVDGDAPGTRVDRGAIVGDIAWYRYRADWSRRNLAQRLRYTAKLRSRQRLRWALPRLPGLPVFLRVKTAMARWRMRHSASSGTPGTPA